MIRIGLTGSIAMGKSTTAAMFAEEGAIVIDADAMVAALYGVGGAGVQAIVGLAPEAVINGAVDRDRLRAAVAADGSLLSRIEAVIHPLVKAEREAAVETARAAGATVIVFDIPLLLETGAEAEVDLVVVVSAPAAMQRERALARPGMTAERFEMLLARQMPDAEKRARADYVIDTSAGLEPVRAAVRCILTDLKAEKDDA